MTSAIVTKSSAIAKTNPRLSPATVIARELARNPTGSNPWRLEQCSYCPPALRGAVLAELDRLNPSGKVG